MTIENPPAFPSTCLNDPCHPASAPGMTLRDWFAGQVIASEAALPVGWGDYSQRAQRAYAQADAMLATRLSAHSVIAGGE